jgi:hypothetical protein
MIDGHAKVPDGTLSGFSRTDKPVTGVPDHLLLSVPGQPFPLGVHSKDLVGVCIDKDDPCLDVFPDRAELFICLFYLSCTGYSIARTTNYTPDTHHTTSNEECRINNYHPSSDWTRFLSVTASPPELVMPQIPSRVTFFAGG